MSPSAVLRRPVPPVVWEVLAGLAVLAGRAWARSLSDLWRDWISILCVYLIFTAFGSRSRAWPFATGLVMAGLLALYSGRQFPLSMAALGLAP
jgi:hypothetical protein